ncbi:hypothetical protein [Streptomyces sp. NPDC056227]|uniref:hypothetical protein n=1 Tax=Streptomyces sp. NPDC056227 TaxID=3345753 RepID=UPI0035D94164
MQDIALASQDQARTLTDRIKVAVEGTWLLIQEAYTSRAWAALGYQTWDAYCAAEFGETRLRLPREERQEVVASLRESGLSTRAIASATGLSKGTIGRDLATAPIGAVEEIAGTNGKAYAATRPVPDPHIWVEPGEPIATPVEPLPSGQHRLERFTTEVVDAEPVDEPVAQKVKRRPLPEAFTDAGRDFTRAAERLARLTEDDRFPKNRETTHHQVPELLGALDHTVRLVQAMDLPAAEANEEARRWWATSLHNISDALTGVANSLEKEQS